MTATDRLTSALAALAADDGRVPCGTPADHQLWTSDDPAERLIAVVLCTGCPLLEVCGQAGEEGGEIGVWGGRDLGIVPWRRRVESKRGAA